MQCKASSPVVLDVLPQPQIFRTLDSIPGFRVTTGNNFSPQPPDVIRLNFGLTEVLVAYTARVAELYDGNTLLGTHRSTLFGSHVGLLNLDPSNSWRTPTSLWNFDNPGVADFTTILDGTIDGRIDYTVETGEHSIPLNQINLNFIKATGASGGWVVTPAPTITSIEIIPVGGYCVGDLDGDGDTDLADLGILLADFGCPQPGPCAGDLDGDGDTDLADLGILLADFGCTP